MAKTVVTIKQMKEMIKEVYGKEIQFDLDNLSMTRLGEMYEAAKMCHHSRQKLNQMMQEQECYIM